MVHDFRVARSPFSASQDDGESYLEVPGSPGHLSPSPAGDHWQVASGRAGPAVRPALLSSQRTQRNHNRRRTRRIKMPNHEGADQKIISGWGGWMERLCPIPSLPPLKGQRGSQHHLRAALPPAPFVFPNYPSIPFSLSPNLLPF